MGINYFYKEKDTEELHGNNAVVGNYDFNTKKELKARVKQVIKNYACPSCGGHRVDGDKLVVEIGKVRFYKETYKKGFFGGKYTEKHQKDMFRIYGIYLQASGFLSFAGYLKCKSCGWEQKGAKGVQWLSLNDIANGRF